MVIKSHRLRAKLITVTAVAIIFVAVVFSVFRFAIPYIPDFKKDIATALSDKLGVVVEISAVDADIFWLVPYLKLLDVNLYEEKNRRHFLHLDELSLSLNWIESIRHLKPRLGFISIAGANLDIVRKTAGKYVVLGFEIDSSGAEDSSTALPEFLDLIDGLSLYVTDGSLRWQDEANSNQLIDLRRVNISLVNSGSQHEISLDMELPAAYGEYLQLVTKFNGDLLDSKTWQGEIYAGFMNLRVKKWIDDYWQYLNFTATGRVDGDVWLGFKENKISYITSYLDANHLSIHYLDEDVRSWALDYLTGNFRWQQQHSGWSFDVRDLDMGHESGGWPFPAALSVQRDSQKNMLDVQANFMRVDSLAYLTGLVTSMFTIEGFDWHNSVAPYKPGGDLFDFQLSLPLDHPEKLKINSRFHNLGYTSSAGLPSVSGLDGRLEYDGQGTVLTLDSRDVELDFNGLFRNTITLRRAEGELGIHHDGAGWHLTSDYFEMDTPHIETRSRLDVVIPDNGVVFMDMNTEFLRGDATYTRQYLPTAIMSDGAVDWLDKSIVKGEITYGGFLLHGNLQDFPFNHGEGVMEVLFNVRGTTLDYRDNWPALENLWAMVRFYNKSMDIERGRGTISGANFLNTSVSIADFSDLHLSILGEVKSPLADMLNFVASSPLQDVLGTYITGLETQGESGLSLDIQIPIDKAAQAEIKGKLNFINNEIFLPNEKYRLKDLNGQLLFTGSSVEGNSLYASLGDSPVGINVASVKQADRQMTRISLDTYTSVTNLLAPVPALSDYLQGKADWKVNIDIPTDRIANTNKVDVYVNSNLQGVSSILPGSFAKEEGQSGEFAFHLAVENDAALKMNVNYDKQYDVNLNYRKNRWMVDVDSSTVRGRLWLGETLSDPVRANLDYLNLVAQADGQPDSKKQQIKPVDLPQLDLQVAKLKWKNWQFQDVNLQTHKSKNGLIIDHLELHGPSISLMASGSWDSSWRTPHTTKLKFNLSTNDLGQCLNALDITQSIVKSDGNAQGEWQWDAEPYNFSWDLLKGSLGFKLEDGSLRDIDPGAGRVLGLLNFETLLSFDFGGQVAEGFSFDEMKANFVFADGIATTEDFKIESKSADITLNGNIGMLAEDYNMAIEVFPKYGNTATIAAVASGGPLLGAVVHYFQKIVGLDTVVGHKYAVTGPWDKPRVVKVAQPKPAQSSKKNDFENDL